MIFKEHSNLKGSHALFGASKSSWLRYSPEKMRDTIKSQWRVSLGTDIHEFASFQIQLNHKIKSNRALKDSIESYIFQKYFNNDYSELNEYGKKMLFHLSELPSEVFETVKLFINDAVGFRMNSEQVLYFSDLFYGTTDAISFRDNFLRIHDLKTGSGKVDMEQLMIYAALFCLEYEIKPGEIEMELRIYQNGEVLYFNPQADDILPIMDKIVSDNKYLQKHYFKEH